MIPDFYFFVIPGMWVRAYLDVGCGNGAAAIHLAQKYHLDVTGIDVDPDQIRLAEAQSQTLAHARFLTIDGAQLPFEDGQFDIVFTNKVTHHIPNWEDAVAEMIRTLGPGGYLIYSDLVFPAPIAALGKAVAGNLSGFPTRRGLEELVRQNDLSVAHCSAWSIHYEGVFQKGL